MSMRDEQSSSGDRSSSHDRRQDQPEDDASYLRKLLETLSVEDPAVFNELVLSNSQLADEFHRANPHYDQIRDALTQDVLSAGVHLPTSVLEGSESGDGDLAFAKIVAQIKGRLVGEESGLRPMTAGSSESSGPAGILTDVTRQLSAEQAQQLFAKLAPMLVYTTLKHMDCDCSFVEVDRIAGHLCSDDVQMKLRSAEHTRDALIDEFSLAFVAQGVKESLNRDQMTRLLEESGAISDLMAMSNCILLAKTQAG
jgi:hypothetical protein